MKRMFRTLLLLTALALFVRPGQGEVDGPVIRIIALTGDPSADLEMDFDIDPIGNRERLSITPGPGANTLTRGPGTTVAGKDEAKNF